MRVCLCVCVFILVYVCACVYLFVMTSRRLHDGHNMSDYPIDTTNAASTFHGGEGNRSDHNPPSCSCDTSSGDVWAKYEKRKKIAPTSHAKGSSSAGCVQISFGKSQHAHKEPYCF